MLFILNAGNFLILLFSTFINEIFIYIIKILFKMSDLVFKMADFLLQNCINEDDCTWGKAGTSEKMRRGCPDFVKPPKNNWNGSYDIFV